MPPRLYYVNLHEGVTKNRRETVTEKGDWSQAKTTATAPELSL